MVWALATLWMLSGAVRAQEEAPAQDVGAQVLAAAGHVLEGADNAPWKTAVLGEGDPSALQIVLEDTPSIYAGARCDSGALPRICESREGRIYCATPAVEALIALDADRGHPSVPLLHALAHEVGHLAGAGPGLAAGDLVVDLAGKAPAARVEAIGEVLGRYAAAADAEAEADTYADLLLVRRLARAPYNTSPPAAHAAVLERARDSLREVADCMLDDPPARRASDRDIQRGARQLLCAATEGKTLILAAFGGSHPHWPGRIDALHRALGEGADDERLRTYYGDVTEALEAQYAALKRWPPACDAPGVASFLEPFDDVPMVCPRFKAALATSEWTPAARILRPASGDQLSLRGVVDAAPVLASGRVGLVLTEGRQIGTWTPGEDLAELVRVPCAPTWMIERDGGLLASCRDPAGVVEVRDGRVRMHALTELDYGGEAQDVVGAGASWLWAAEDGLWLTGQAAAGVGFGLGLTDWSAGSLAAWKGEGCETLVRAGGTAIWRPDPEGEVHAVTSGEPLVVFRLDAEGALLGREDPGAWEDYAWEIDLAAGPVLGCGPAFAQQRTVCLDSRGSIFDPVPDPLEFDIELSTGRSLRGEDPDGGVCDSAGARYVLLHDRGTDDAPAWVIRHREGETEEVLIRHDIGRATLACGPAGATVVLGNDELSRISWLR